MANQNRDSEIVTVHDLNQAEIKILQTIQEEAFADEINCLQKGKNIF